MKYYQTGAALAKDMGVDLAVLEKTHSEHYAAAKKTEKDPDGGPHPAYPTGKSWDEASGKTGSGKKFYHNIIDGPAVKGEEFYVAIITPVIHYCMGGLEIDTDSACIGADGKAIPGLYAAGEVAGGVHGNNRLGGNSLLDCVVFGRVAGLAATKYMLGAAMKPVDLVALSGGGLTGEVKSSKNAGGSYEDDMNKTEKKTEGGGGGGGGGIPLSEVAKHATKNDCWVVVNNQVLNVTSFLPNHPGGELAILTFAGRDATEEFNMIHPPDVIPKYAPDAIIGEVGTGAPAAGAVGGAAAAPRVVPKDKGSVVGNHQAWGHLDGTENWRFALDDTPGVLLVNVQAYINAAWFLLFAILYEVGATIFTSSNIKIDKDRTGLTRSAIFLIFFIVIHAVGNLHVFLGPNDFNGYGYFYVRLYWTGFGLPANIVEEYLILCAMLHVFVGLKRTWDSKLQQSWSNLMTLNPFTNTLSLAVSGLGLLTFMTIHLIQFRFGDTSQFGAFMVCPPAYLINLWPGILTLSLFWDATCETPVGVRDIYKLEFQIFQNPLWAAFYVLSVTFFMFHACMGWKNCVNAGVLGIPNGHKKRVHIIGYLIFVVLGSIYISFPAYCLAYPEYATAK